MVCNVHNQANGNNRLRFGIADLKLKPIMIIDADRIIARTFQGLKIEGVKREQLFDSRHTSQSINSFLILFDNLRLKPILLVFGLAIQVQFFQILLVESDFHSFIGRKNTKTSKSSLKK
jgi:hypothetical protein